MIHTKYSRIVTVLIEMIAPVLTVFTYMTAKLFPISSYVQTLNRFMTNRMALVKKRVDKRSPSMRPLIPHFELELGTLLSVLCCIM